ncbi:MAG TPA: hypothetical protein VKA89_04135 [Solirubrobacterales bacterium]|nr:hypothetical protein [Solirubrobacterales bacterium]
MGASPWGRLEVGKPEGEDHVYHHRCQHCGLVNPEPEVQGTKSWRCRHCHRTNRAAVHVPHTLLEQVMQMGDGGRRIARR